MRHTTIRCDFSSYDSTFFKQVNILVYTETAAAPSRADARPRPSRTCSLSAMTSALIASAAQSALLLALCLLCQVAHAALPGFHDTGPAESTVPLIQALVDENYTHFRELLLADPSQVDGIDVITPLYAAQEYVRSSRQRHDVIRRLLRAGARPDRTTQDGSTPLMLAAYHGDVRTAQMLLEHGADPLRTNKQGHSAITAAQNGRHGELAEMLREHVGESGLRRMADEQQSLKVEL